MKMNNIFYSIVIIVLLVGVYKLYTAPFNTFRDILDSKRDYRDRRPLHIDYNNLPVISKSTEKDIYKMFGKDVDSRRSYNPSKKSTINGNTFYYDKVIEYEDYIYKYKTERTGDLLVSGGYPIESWSVDIYLLKGLVVNYSLIHDKRNDNLDTLIIDKDTSINVPERFFEVEDSMIRARKVRLKN